MLAPGLINHALKPKTESTPVRDREQVRFPGFNDCKEPLVCMEARRDLDTVRDYVVILPFRQLIDRASTTAARREMYEQLKRKYARDLKQILTEHPSWAVEMGMTAKQVAEFKPEDVAPQDFVDVPGDYRAR